MLAESHMIALQLIHTLLTCIWVDILHFDNSFSWITSKQLRYIVEILPPEEATQPDENSDMTKTPMDNEIKSNGNDE